MRRGFWQIASGNTVGNDLLHQGPEGRRTGFQWLHSLEDTIASDAVLLPAMSLRLLVV
jgi:hypothetical protein